MAARRSGSVRVRAYNVRFGDCVLVSFGPASAEKHILIDFGNAPAQVRGDGGKNDAFAPVAKDLAKRTNKRIDLLVVSHEHLDHIEGFYDQRRLFDTFTVGEVWMSKMSAPSYYDTHPQCEKEKRARLALLDTAKRWDGAGRFDALPEAMRALIANNVLALSNKERIDYLRSVGKAKVKYLSRSAKPIACKALGGAVKLEVLAPEEDASVYYGAKNGRFWLDAAARLGGGPARESSAGRARTPSAPAQMPRDEFERLRDEIAQLDVMDLLAIDKAANNTSLVLRITVAGKVLLFPGDAEGESWAVMKKRKLLGPVDFLKLAHHGSINGMPFQGAEEVFSQVVKPGKKTVALVSTCRGVYGDSKETEIPHHALMDRLKERCKRVVVTQDDAMVGAGCEIAL